MVFGLSLQVTLAHMQSRELVFTESSCRQLAGTRREQARRELFGTSGDSFIHKAMPEQGSSFLQANEQRRIFRERTGQQFFFFLKKVGIFLCPGMISTAPPSLHPHFSLPTHGSDSLDLGNVAGLEETLFLDSQRGSQPKVVGRGMDVRISFPCLPSQGTRLPGLVF